MPLPIVYEGVERYLEMMDLLYEDAAGVRIELRDGSLRMVGLLGGIPLFGVAIKGASGRDGLMLGESGSRLMLLLQNIEPVWKCLESSRGVQDPCSGLTEPYSESSLGVSES